MVFSVKNDPSYKKIFEPLIHVNPLSEPTNDLERVLYSFVEAQLGYTSASDGVTHSINRYLEAEEAEEVEYEIMQADAVVKYSDKAVEHLAEINHVLPKLKQIMGSIEIGKGKRLLDVEPEVIQAFQQKLTTEGFSKETKQQYKALGLSEEEIQGLRDKVISMDPEVALKDFNSYLEELQAFTEQSIETYKDLSASYLSKKRKAVARSLPESIPAKCDVCNMPLTWIEQYQRWYCHNCSEYR